jgi:hypothetical protein
MTKATRTLILALGAMATSLAPACSSNTARPAGGDAGGGAGDGGALGPSTCDAIAPNAAGDLEVAEESLQGYPPYAAHDCTLVYIRRSSGALVARDLGTGVERVVAPATEGPRRPTIAAGLIAWEATIGGVDGVPGVRAEYNGQITTLSGSFHHASEPRAANDLVSFTAWASADAKGDADVLVFHAQSGAYETVAAGAGQQRFSDVSETHVAVSDFSEDPDGRFDDDGADLADLGIYDLRTKTLTLRKNPGKDAFPFLASPDLFGYMHWGDIHPEPKFEAFGLRAGKIGEAPALDRKVADVMSSSAVIQPSAKNGILAWVTNDRGAMQLWRAPADGSSPGAAVAGLDRLSIYAPAISDRFTIVAARDGSGGPPTLRILPR